MPEEALVEYHTAHQEVEESLAKWAGRLLELAHCAFEGWGHFSKPPSAVTIGPPILSGLLE